MFKNPLIYKDDLFYRSYNLKRDSPTDFQIMLKTRK